MRLIVDDQGYDVVLRGGVSEIEREENQREIMDEMCHTKA